MDSDSFAERRAFCEVINNVLSQASGIFPANFYSYYLPVAAENLMERCRDGILLAYLLVPLAPETKSSLRSLNPCQLHTFSLEAQPVNDSASSIPTVLFACRNNLDTVLTVMAKAAGVPTVNVGASDIMEMKKSAIGFIWQIVRNHLLCNMSVFNSRELLILIKPEESLEDFVAQRPEVILSRWINFHLSQSPYNQKHSRRQLATIAADLRDGEIYALLLSQIAPDIVSDRVLHDFMQQEHITSRIVSIIQWYNSLDCRKYLEPFDILDANAKLSIAFLSELFKKRIGISLGDHASARLDALGAELDVLIEAKNKKL